ncbi:methyltransferase domain-containing protein [Helicobacter sp. 11S02596-1]|uniref:methyltransferase domain-containing protein n=1 Tax=Helicobacter sp. 11S02596-1 TaxID=1476194 RepID=UPI0015DD6A78|nr:methyltransferase domain-containing protein [Helicobacter sp. 11S02596-1]
MQNLVASKLLKTLGLQRIDSLIDIGCGSGNIAYAIDKIGIYVNDFIGIDIADTMLASHPKALPCIQNISLFCQDFETFSFQAYDVGIAASSLQWASDLESVLKRIAGSCAQVAFGIYTNKSLSSLHSFLGTASPLRDEKTLREILGKYFNGKVWLEYVKQDFTSRTDFLKHLKYLGLLGGGVLGYTEAKRFRENVPYACAEYEILMFVGRPRITTECEK